jgi:hypothetical protein
MFKQYKNKGLEVMWIISETQKKGEIASWEWINNWKKEKNVTVSVMRDFKFFQTYGAIQPASSSLPHLFVLDGNTMELVAAAGGLGSNTAAAESKILELLSGIAP